MPVIPKMAQHIRSMEVAPMEEVKNGDWNLPNVKDKALWALFYNVWLKGKPGLERYTRRGEGIMTWRLIYDEITGDKGHVAVKYRTWLGALYSKPRPKTLEESKAVFDEIKAKNEDLKLADKRTRF